MSILPQTDNFVSPEFSANDNRSANSHAALDLSALVETMRASLISPVTIQLPPSVKIIDNNYAMPPLPEAAHLDATVAESACKWLDNYIAHSRRWSPRGYDDSHEAAGLFVLSATAAGRVVLNFGGERATNLYIAQVIRTSTMAKTTTANIGTDLLHKAKLDHLLLPDELTPQAMLRLMSQRIPDNWNELPTSTQEKIKRRLAFAAQRGWFYDEFGGKIQAMMKDGSVMADFRTLLRKFDDRKDEFEYETIAHGSISLQSPYLTLLANTTPADLRPYAKRSGALWNDGFWARFVFLTPPPDSGKYSTGRFPSEEYHVSDNLIRPLQQWHEYLGTPLVDVKEFKTADGKTTKFELSVTTLPIRKCKLGDGVFNAFYTYADALRELTGQSSNTDLDGNYTRLPEKALRTAMLLASLENGGRIELPHWARAQQIAERWRQNLHNLYAAVTEGHISRQVDMETRILNMISERGALTRREIYSSIRGLSSEEANKLLLNMAKAGLLVSVAEGKTEKFCLADLTA